MHRRPQVVRRRAATRQLSSVLLVFGFCQYTQSSPMSPLSSTSTLVQAIESTEAHIACKLCSDRGPRHGVYRDLRSAQSQNPKDTIVPEHEGLSSDSDTIQRQDTQPEPTTKTSETHRHPEPTLSSTTSSPTVADDSPPSSPDIEEVMQRLRSLKLQVIDNGVSRGDSIQAVRGFQLLCALDLADVVSRVIGLIMKDSGR